MSRYRYLIERGGGDEVGLTTLEAGDDSGRGYSEVYGATEAEKVEKAKALAAQDPASPEGGLRWSDPPKAWQPDAIAISGWLDDGVEENRDR